jgi:MFS family permease
MHGWQVAFLAVGLPGVLLALWVNILREPVRGQSDGLRAAPYHPHPFRECALELRAVLPPLTLLNLIVIRAGAGQIALNLLAATACAGAAAFLTALLGTPSQWMALAVGLYAAISWSQSLAVRDHQAFTMIFRTPALRYAAVGFALLSFTGYGIGFWVVPFFIRVHGVSAARAGVMLGGLGAVAGWAGVTLGGLWADQWRRHAVNGRIYVGICTGLLPLPFIVWMLSTERLWLAYLLQIPAGIGASLWIGPGASTVQDLVLPRMRATASAAYLLVVTFIGLALGPYTIGRLSVALGNLRMAMVISLSASLLAVLCLIQAARHLPGDEAMRQVRARQ